MVCQLVKATELTKSVVTVETYSSLFSPTISEVKYSFTNKVLYFVMGCVRTKIERALK